MNIQSYRRHPQLRSLQSPAPKSPVPKPRPEPTLSKQRTMDIGATAANTLVAGISAGIGNLASQGGPVLALAAGVGGAVTGAVVGGLINFKAMEVAERKSPSDSMYGLLTVGLNVASSMLTGTAAAVAGYYGANILVTGAVGGATTAGVLALFNAAL